MTKNLQKYLYPLCATAVFLLAGFWSFNHYIYSKKQADTTQVIEPYRSTLTGEYLCLPPVDQNGPQTLECALGLKTDSGEYYALDFMLMSQTPPVLATGERFTASGVIAPIETLSTDHWKKYPIEGIFSVTDMAQDQE